MIALEHHPCRQKDYTRPVNFVSSGRTGEEGDGTGDEDSDYGEEVRLTTPISCTVESSLIFLPTLFGTYENGLILDVMCNAMYQELDEEAKRILEQLEQQKLDRGGQKAGIGKFTHASLEKNKKLSMFKTQEQKSKQHTLKKEGIDIIKKKILVWRSSTKKN